jgi:hypothetical protein
MAKSDNEKKEQEAQMEAMKKELIKLLKNEIRGVIEE